MNDCSTLFKTALLEYEGLIWSAARRYHIPGLLDPEDLYQEGCIILAEMLRDGTFEAESIDFQKMFKTKLWH